MSQEHGKYYNPQEFGITLQWGFASPTLGKEKGQRHQSQLAIPFAKEGTRLSIQKPTPFLLLPSIIHPYRFLHIGIAQVCLSFAVVLPALQLCLPLLTLPRVGPQYTTSRAAELCPVPLKLMVVLHWMQYRGISSSFPQRSTNWASVQHRNSSWAPGLIWKLFNTNDMLPA